VDRRFRQLAPVMSTLVPRSSAALRCRG
jgi:hypothetical protein